MIPATQREARHRARIGRYLVTGRIGRGGMGTVYRARDEVLEREVAVKVLTVEGALDAESRRRFEVEAKAAARLQHPNIVTVYELGEDRGIPFIAMELLSGVDLDSLLRSGEEIALQEKLEVLVQVCRGLEYAHERSIVHRDIKPSNIRLLDDGTAKILDFGIAKLGGTQLTKSGMMVGTIHYMSPEQIRGAPLTGQSDLFSVGVILYELVAGRRPFAGEASTEILYRIVHDPPQALGAGGDRSGPAIESLVDRLLAKDPAQRPPSAGAVADAMAEILREHFAAAAAPAAAAAGDVALARGLLRDGRRAEAIAKLEGLLLAHPAAIEARRALRQARRSSAAGAVEPALDDFPELEGTFQATPTQRTPETLVEPEVRPAPVESPARLGLARALRWGLSFAALVIAAAVALPWLARGRRDGAPEQVPTVPSTSSGAEVTRPAETGEIPLVTEPPGARVSLDGAALPGLTPLTLTLDPGREHRVAVAKDGYRDQEIRVPVGAPPAEVRVTLTEAGPPGVVAIASSYPLDVLWRGKALARGQRSPRVSLTPGRQTLSLVAPAVFLRSNVVVDVRAAGEVSIAAPQVGVLSIRANPDNCEVLIDGTFVDYPPILNHSVAAGSHSVVFKWPDGRKKEEIVRVAVGPVTYVMGRKD
jgi:hypothetical protein